MGIALLGFRLLTIDIVVDNGLAYLVFVLHRLRRCLFCDNWLALDTSAVLRYLAKWEMFQRVLPERNDRSSLEDAFLAEHHRSFPKCSFLFQQSHPARRSNMTARKRPTICVDLPPYYSHDILMRENISTTPKSATDSPIDYLDDFSCLKPDSSWLRRSPMDTCPIRPQPEPRCTVPECPVIGVHAQGIYLWEGEPPTGLIDEIFGPSNPPPRIAAAYELVENPVPGICPIEQRKLWENFYRYHTKPVEPNQMLGYTARTKCKSEDCPLQDLLDHHREGAYFHEKRQHWTYTNAFGWANPPPEIWEARERQGCHEGTEEELERDRQIVQVFASHHGLFPGTEKPNNQTNCKKRKRSSGGNGGIVGKSSVSKFIIR